MTERLSVTMPDDIHKKMIDHMKTWPLETRNISKYISNLVNTHTPKLEKNID